MNTPNKITTLRIILIPFMIFFYLADFIPWGKIVSVAIFIVAALTDFLDGYIARKYNLVTNLGKLLDPMADKLLVISALLLLVADKTIPSPYGVIIAILIIGRELLISTFRQIAASKNYVMAADKVGKLKTIFQDIAIPGFIMLAYFKTFGVNAVLLQVFSIICYVFIGIATVLTVISGINYLVKNKDVLKG